MVQRLLLDAPSDALAWAYRARLHAAVGEVQDAIAAALEGLVEHSDQREHAWTVLAMVFSALQDDVMAERCFQTAITCNADYAGL